MPIKKASASVVGVRKGASKITKVYKGSSVVWREPKASVFSFGVNISNMEYSGSFEPTIDPAIFDRLALKNVERVRICLSWERMQPTLLGSLASTYLANVHAAVNAALAKGMIVLLEPHNFGRYNNQTIGSGAVPAAAFADFWTRMDAAFRNANVEYDLINEPHDQPNSELHASYVAARNALRSAGYTGWIEMEGNAYAGAWNWVNNNTGLDTVILGDPLGKTRAHIHNYLDSDASGSGFDYDAEVSQGAEAGYATSANVAVNRLTVAVDWCVARNIPFSVGEYGIPQNDPRWITAGRNGLQYIKDHGGKVYIWSDGGSWGDYPQSTAPYLGRQSKIWPMLQEFTGSTDQPIVYYLDGPNRGANGVASTFTVEYRGRRSSFTVTPSDNGGGGAFSPTSVTLTGDNPTATFTYTPSGTKTVEITLSNNGGLTNPAAHLYFTDETDLLSGQTAALAAVQNIVSSYHRIGTYYGPLVRLRRNSDGAQQDFSGAGVALNVANVGKYVDVAAIQTWAGGTTGFSLVRRYDQSGLGQDMQPVYSDGGAATSTADYPACAIVGGKLVVSYNGSRMDMPSALEDATGQTVIAAFKHTSGNRMLAWEFLSAVRFGPAYEMHSDGGTGVPTYEQGDMALGVIPGETHVHAATWQAATTNGWRTWRDGTLFAKNDTVGTALTADFHRNAINVGWFRFGTSTWVGELSEVWVFNAAISDSLNTAIQAQLVSDYATNPATPAAYVDANFAAGTYTVNGASVAASTLVSGTLTVTGGAGLAITPTSGNKGIGALLSTLQGSAWSMVIETQDIAGGAGQILFDLYGPTDHLMLARASDVTWQSFSNARSMACGDTIGWAVPRKNGVSYDASSLSLHREGTSAASDAYAYPHDWTDLFLGRAQSGTSNGVTGKIRRIRVWNTKLTDAQMLALTTNIGTKGTSLSATYLGANLAGWEFGFPFPPETGQAAYYKGKGQTILRIPFLWERMQPTLGGALDSTNAAQMDAIVAAATAQGQATLLDCHNYSAFNNVTIGTGGGPTFANLANLWSRLATRYASNPLVFYGIMNEPNGPLTSAAWITGMNTVMSAIRTAGATALITVPVYNTFTGAHNYVSSGNAAASLSLSGSNFAVELHQYLDSNNSGSTGETVRYKGGSVLNEATAFARTNGQRLFLGEFGFDKDVNNPLASAEGYDLVKHMADNNDVWLGGTYWAGGDHWPEDYFSKLNPTLGFAASPTGEHPQMGILKRWAA